MCEQKAKKLPQTRLNLLRLKKAKFQIASKGFTICALFKLLSQYRLSDHISYLRSHLLVLPVLKLDNPVRKCGSLNLCLLCFLPQISVSELQFSNLFIVSDSLRIPLLYLSFLIGKLVFKRFKLLLIRHRLHALHRSGGRPSLRLKLWHRLGDWQ